MGKWIQWLQELARSRDQAGAGVVMPTRTAGIPIRMNEETKKVVAAVSAPRAAGLQLAVRMTETPVLPRETVNPTPAITQAIATVTGCTGCPYRRPRKPTLSRLGCFLGYAPQVMWRDGVCPGREFGVRQRRDGQTEQAADVDQDSPSQTDTINS